MITIGLTTWSEHPILNDGNMPVSLNTYAAYFPTVEIDNSFYGVPLVSVVSDWVKKVPNSFQFIIKANQFMTKHDLRGSHEISTLARHSTFDNFVHSIESLISSNKLKTILFQFPPFFNLNRENLDYLFDIRKLMPHLPITVEFRNSSWYHKNNRLITTKTLRQLNFTEVIVDEPHSLNTGVPFYPVITNSNLTMIRLHGRNNQGWNNRSKNWRKERTLYRYSDEELSNLAKIIDKLDKKSKEVCIIFNNNSGKDAAPNALKLIDILNLHFKGLSDRQLSLF